MQIKICQCPLWIQAHPVAQSDYGSMQLGGLQNYHFFPMNVKKQKIIWLFQGVGLGRNKLVHLLFFCFIFIFGVASFKINSLYLTFWYQDFRYTNTFSTYHQRLQFLGLLPWGIFSVYFLNLEEVIFNLDKTGLEFVDQKHIFHIWTIIFWGWVSVNKS